MTINFTDANKTLAMRGLQLGTFEFVERIHLARSTTHQQSLVSKVMTLYVKKRISCLFKWLIARTKAFYGVDNLKSFTQLTRAVKKFLSLLQSVWQALRLNHSTQGLPAALSPGAKGSEREYNHSPISSAHVRRRCSCASTFPYTTWGAKR